MQLIILFLFIFLRYMEVAYQINVPMFVLYEMNGQLYAESLDHNIVIFGSEDIPKKNDEPEKKEYFRERSSK